MTDSISWHTIGVILPDKVAKLVYIGSSCILLLGVLSLLPGVVRYIHLFTLDLVVFCYRESWTSFLVLSNIYACLHWILLYFVIRCLQPPSWCHQIYMLVYIGYGCILLFGVLSPLPGVVRYICLFALDFVVFCYLVSWASFLVLSDIYACLHWILLYFVIWCLESAFWVLPDWVVGNTNDLDSRRNWSPAQRQVWSQGHVDHQPELPGTAEQTDCSDHSQPVQGGENQVWDAHHHPRSSAWHLWRPGEF